MAGTSEKKDPKLWDKVKEKVTKGDKGGKPGQWSARKAQLAVHDYKAEGGEYKGAKAADNHLAQWTKEEWGTKSGQDSGDTGERYLPKRARKALSADEYARSTAKKRADTRKGKQVSAQPKDVARKTAATRVTGQGEGAGTAGAARKAATAAGKAERAPTAKGLAAMGRAELLERAGARNVPGRSRMRKSELVQALGG